MVSVHWLRALLCSGSAVSIGALLLVHHCYWCATAIGTGASHRRLHVFGLLHDGRRVGGVRGIHACLGANGNSPGRVCLAPACSGHAKLARSRLHRACSVNVVLYRRHASSRRPAIAIWLYSYTLYTHTALYSIHAIHRLCGCLLLERCRPLQLRRGRGRLSRSRRLRRLHVQHLVDGLLLWRGLRSLRRFGSAAAHAARSRNDLPLCSRGPMASQVL